MVESPTFRRAYSAVSGLAADRKKGHFRPFFVSSCVSGGTA